MLEGFHVQYLYWYVRELIISPHLISRNLRETSEIINLAPLLSTSTDICRERMFYLPCLADIDCPGAGGAHFGGRE